MKKRFNVWLSESEIELLKKKARKNKTSVSGFLKQKAFEILK
jgi:hypothetical protein